MLSSSAFSRCCQEASSSVYKRSQVTLHLQSDGCAVNVQFLQISAIQISAIHNPRLPAEASGLCSVPWFGRCPARRRRGKQHQRGCTARLGTRRGARGDRATQVWCRFVTMFPFMQPSCWWRDGAFIGKKMLSFSTKRKPV